jgi:hypothetical protein
MCQLQAMQRGHVRIRAGVQTRCDEVDNFDFAVFPRTRFKKLLFARFNSF